MAVGFIVEIRMRPRPTLEHLNGSQLNREFEIAETMLPWDDDDGIHVVVQGAHYAEAWRRALEAVSLALADFPGCLDPGCEIWVYTGTLTSTGLVIKQELLSTTVASVEADLKRICRAEVAPPPDTADLQLAIDILYQELRRTGLAKDMPLALREARSRDIQRAINTLRRRLGLG